MVSIIIPAYNEAQAIGETLRELSQGLSSCEFAYEILVINDGSTDDTESIVRGMEDEHIRCVSHRLNKGYGSAIVTGVKNAKGEIVIWYDADGQHRPEDLIRVINKMEEENLDLLYRGAQQHILSGQKQSVRKIYFEKDCEPSGERADAGF